MENDEREKKLKQMVSPQQLIDTLEEIVEEIRGEKSVLEHNLKFVCVCSEDVDRQTSDERELKKLNERESALKEAQGYIKACWRL